MLICRQGNGHYLSGINNQDFCYEEKNLKLITDGCSEGKYSEVGTRLFIQLFSKLDKRLKLEDFEENVENVFSSICSLASKGKNSDKTDFIVDNMLFTIIACFELEDKFVVKFIGDGYLVTVNKQDMVSYIRLSYGKTPPYYAYNKISTQSYKEALKFKTFEFPKKVFNKVGIATDGIMPIAERKIPDDVEPIILGKEDKYTVEGIINSNQSSFFDDVTFII